MPSVTRALQHSTVATATCDALQTLPQHHTTRIDGDHVFAEIAEDWYCLVGPDTEDGFEIERAAGSLPGEWTVVFESYGHILLTHFYRV
jgi:hypothetical protein